MAPNLFLEAQSFGGNLDVAKGLVVLDGANGSTILHTLQNHLLNKPVHDDNAYAFPAIFLARLLSLQAHHITAPAKPVQWPRYHATQPKAYALIGDHEVWHEGNGAFGNLGMLTRTYRDRFIRTANASVLKHNTKASCTRKKNPYHNRGTLIRRLEPPQLLELTDVC
jgi:hypothetical protein